MRVLCPIVVGWCVLVACAGAASLQAAESPARAEYLRCEYRVDPLGIDVVEPRLSWEMHDGRRGAKQIAYQVLVASSPQTLAINQGDLWDSGRVDSDQSAQVVYAGRPLASRTRCYWKVRIWDANGNSSPYSKPALWTMGLLKPDDVKAKWIGVDGPMIHPTQREADAAAPSFDGCAWMWCAEAGINPRVKAPQGERWFRGAVTVPAGRKIRQARFLITADDGLTLFVNGKWSGQASGFNNPQIYDVAANLKPGQNLLAIEGSNDAPSPAGLLGKLVVDFDQGEPLVARIDTSWKTCAKELPGWNAPEFDDSKWAAAVEIAKMGDKPWGHIKVGGHNTPLACPLFRKEFQVRGEVRRATVYGSALGNYRLHVNGQPVGDDYFTPDWTDYRKRVYYNTYDVTKLIRSDGLNAIGGVLAGGWYADPIGWERRRYHYGDRPRLFAQLEIELADGTVQTIATDGSWKTAFGPCIEGEFLAGETYDATQEIPGWDMPGLNDSGWHAVAVTDSIAAKFQGFPGVTVQETGVLKPIKITEPRPGVYVFDMAQDFAGFARLKARGPKGTKVVLRFAEMLNPDGTIYTTNLRSARATDTYVLKGGGEEIWQPRFTFHGFRYVQVTGYPGKPGLDAVTGIAVNSNVPLTGSFECSSPMVNRLYQNVVWTQRANYISVPTDCPQRDERLGWTGDAETFVRAATYNADVAAFFTKWLVDLDDAQGPTGDFPDVAPRIVAMGGGTAAWADAGTICPATIYYVYNDRRLLAQHYPAMCKWVEYCRNHSKGLLRPNDGYGDWLSIRADTPKDVLATAYFAHSTWLTGKAAEILGKEDDARKYHDLFQQIRAAFNKAYVADDGRIKGNTQTCYVLGLAFDLLPADKRPAAIRYLVDDIKSRGNHLSTGFVGTSVLMSTLSAVGHTDLAYKLLLNDTFPSWGYSIKHGATSIWERWDGWTAEKGFQDPGMNSFAHYSFGAVAQWMFQTVAGIDIAPPGFQFELANPGFQELWIHPQPAAGLTWVKAGYRSLHGQIASQWKIDAGKLTLDVTIPANTTAWVCLPIENGANVTESGSAVTASALDVLPVPGGSIRKQWTIHVPAGQYHFTMPARK